MKTSNSRNFRFMFLRNPVNKHPVGCIAFTTNSNLIEYQVSTLNPTDHFDRKVARQLALGRLLEKPITLTGASSNTTLMVRRIMNDISANSNLPNRSQRAAQAWLKLT